MRLRNKIGRKGVCGKCKGPMDESRIGKYGYCKKCHAQYMREHRPKHSLLSPEQRKKANVRAYVKEYVKSGKVERKPCEKCGEKAEMHHEDYSKPLEVIWLCRKHHLELHNNLRKCQTQYQQEYK